MDMYTYLCMYVWVNASPRSPSSAPPCDDGQELLVCVDLYLALVISHGQGGSLNWMYKGEESRDQGVALLNNVCTVRLRWGE